MDRRGAILARIRFLRSRLAHTKRLMATIGKIVQDSCRESFTLQKLGDIHWEPRYARTLDEPFINIAGALSDWKQGFKAPRKVQFHDQPALLSTGSLRANVISKVTQDREVTTANTMPYAVLHQEGGESIQEYDESVKAKIRAWLQDAKGNVRKAKSGYEKHIEPLLHKNSLHTEVIARPFIGVTDEARAQILSAVESHFGGKAT